MIDFLNGTTAALCAVAGVLFLKFWTGSRDRLLLLFALTFWILAANRLVAALLPYVAGRQDEHHTAIYVVRLAAFLLILVAIIDKNRRQRRHAAIE